VAVEQVRAGVVWVVHILTTAKKTPDWSLLVAVTAFRISRFCLAPPPFVKPDDAGYGSHFLGDPIAHMAWICP
jgi:hypothetical protein